MGTADCGRDILVFISENEPITRSINTLLVIESGDIHYSSCRLLSGSSGLGWSEDSNQFELLRRHRNSELAHVEQRQLQFQELLQVWIGFEEYSVLGCL